jgi:uncharacterized protein YbjT (DUF2867 family)
MSEPRIVLVGATGLIGREISARAARLEGVSLTAIARRAVELPRGANVEPLVADPRDWPHAIEAARAGVLAIALGTTWTAAGRDEAAFRAVDQDLVLSCARAARAAGARRCIVVSSIGARASSRSFYLKVKGEVEDALVGLGFERLDILRPGLLRGARDGEARPAERLAMLASPLTDSLLRGGLRRYRSIPARTVAAAILAIAGDERPGRFDHEHDAIVEAAKRLAGPVRR